MRKIMVIVPVVSSAALVLLVGGTANAADTITTFTLTAGEFTISAPTGTVALGTATAKATAQTVGPFSLGDVTVTDARGGVLGWTASAISSAFTGGSGLAPTAITYTPPVATVTPTGLAVLAAPTAKTDLTAVTAVQVASTVTGPHTAVWNPTLTFAVPAGAIAGTYTATLTHSVA
ncbi:hypothetical protein [Actinophytocola sp.]|uniref:hypothetical protein n=1 Tax=Actinophytocola sp. TaxID=1872138 RepID=UPI002ED40D51